MYQRAPFIWSERQPIQPGGLFSVFLGGAQRRDDGQNRFYLFRRRFELPSLPEASRLTLFVDGRYQLFVNGIRLGRGPARSDPHHPRVDPYEVGPFLRVGENVIGVLVALLLLPITKSPPAGKAKTITWVTAVAMLPPSSTIVTVMV